MKTVCITTLPLGTQFIYKGVEYKVSYRDSYPIIEADRVSGDGLGMCFSNFEKVEVADDTRVLEAYFEQTKPNHFQLKERLK